LHGATSVSRSFEDFADATPVRIAKRESLSLILTIDHDNFETYRIHGRHRFRIVPGRTPEIRRMVSA